MMAMNTEVDTRHGRSRDHRWTIEDNIFSLMLKRSIKKYGDVGDTAHIHLTILESSLTTFAVHIAHERNIFIVVNYVVIYSDENI